MPLEEDGRCLAERGPVTLSCWNGPRAVLRGGARAGRVLPDGPAAARSASAGPAPPSRTAETFAVSVGGNVKMPRAR